MLSTKSVGRYSGSACMGRRQHALSRSQWVPHAPTHRQSPLPPLRIPHRRASTTAGPGRARGRLHLVLEDGDGGAPQEVPLRQHEPSIAWAGAHLMWRMCANMCKCVDAYTSPHLCCSNTPIHTFNHPCHMHSDMHAYKHTYMPACLHAKIHKHTNTYMYTWMRVHAPILAVLAHQVCGRHWAIHYKS